MNNFSVNKNKKYLMTERKYMSKSIFKDNNINNINNNTEMKILNKSKTKDNHYKKEKLITNIKAYNDHNEDNKIINMENDKRKMKKVLSHLIKEEPPIIIDKNELEEEENEEVMKGEGGVPLYLYITFKKDLKEEELRLIKNKILKLKSN